ncbi:hypothetical protein A9Q74_13020 [Colwellia sp. 39_35_sub15_T18]|nr:hypothetical protein A9Q74_13020 [Colwellia sp. 39_35_sub15_T18]
MITLCCITLTACGGGSGESQTAPSKVVTPPATLSFSLAETSLAINEQEKAKITLTLDYTGTGDLSYAIEFLPSTNKASAQVINNDLIITINELENALTSTLSITVSSSNSDVTAIEKTLELSLINTSVEVVLAEVELWKNSEQVFKFDDFDDAVTFYTKSAYFYGGLDNSAIAEKLTEFTAIKQSSMEKKSSPEVTQLAEALANYQNNSITETELKTFLMNVKTMAGAEYNKLAGNINLLASLTNDNLPPLPSLNYQYSDKYQAFSGIIGNTQMGSFDGESWKFNQQYQFLNNLIPSLGNTTTCEAN